MAQQKEEQLLQAWFLKYGDDMKAGSNPFPFSVLEECVYHFSFQNSHATTDS